MAARPFPVTLSDREDFLRFRNGGSQMDSSMTTACPLLPAHHHFHQAPPPSSLAARGGAMHTGARAGRERAARLARGAPTSSISLRRQPDNRRRRPQELCGPPATGVKMRAREKPADGCGRESHCSRGRAAAPAPTWRHGEERAAEGGRACREARGIVRSRLLECRCCFVE